MKNLKKIKDTNELTYKIERDSQARKTNLWLPKGKRGQGGRDNIYTLLYIKIDNQQGLTV